jgi:hypothetical protein
MLEASETFWAASTAFLRAPKSNNSHASVTEETEPVADSDPCVSNPKALLLPDVA